MSNDDQLSRWEERFLEYFTSIQHDDASHDLAHFKRVANTARRIAHKESHTADPLIILSAAYLHDIVSLPKNHPESHMSSRYAALKARDILEQMQFPKERILAVCHAIEAHSFSAKIQPETIEAKIIQDADRMEALGALGIMRTFYVSGRMGIAPYDPADMLAKHRQLDDKSFGLDHFYCKLYKLPELLQTDGGKEIALKRAEFLKYFENQLIADIQKNEGGAKEVVWSCYHAGSKKLALFDSTDPFAKNRPLNPSCIAVDRLIESRSSYPIIDCFLTQLKDEIS